MGSDLYAAVDISPPNLPMLAVGEDRGSFWFCNFIRRTWGLGRHAVVEAFGTSDENLPWSPYHEVNGRSEKKPTEVLHALGYLTTAEIQDAQEDPDCPWHGDEPYWVRAIEGTEFADIVREKRWQTIDVAYSGVECCAELRALAAAVTSLLKEGQHVRVWCWESQ